MRIDYKALPPALSRATLATAFLVSGIGKLRKMDETTGYFTELGIPAPRFMARFVSLTEVTCGALVGAGLLTRLAALPLIPVMAVALLTARRKEFQSFSDLTGIFEFSYIIQLSYLAAYGGGALSLDSLILGTPSERRLGEIGESNGRELLRAA